MLKFEILGSNISILNSYKDCYIILVNTVKNSQKSEYITVNNVHTVVEGIKNKNYKNITNNAILALPDGKPLSIYAKLKGEKNISRIFGPTFFEKTLEWGQEDNLKHYFFGSSRETLNKMLDVIKTKYPKAVVSGSCSPPYRQFTEKENDEFLKVINNSDSDLIWVGLGAPKQEIWMYENYKKMKRGVMIGIGAGFDYLAGNTKHAPEWMKNSSLEWLYRLIQEPGRLWKRYLITNTMFIYFIILELLKLKKFE